MNLETTVRNAFENNKICETSCTNLLKWLTGDDYSDFRDELAALIEGESWTELDDRFYRIIEFGTGGRRGPRGAGTNRINSRTIGESAQGLSEYIHENGDPARGVVVAYDTRHSSREFAEELCAVFAGNNIPAFMYAEPRSTPQLSFSILHLNTQAGCMISASHNPPADNGIKVSWGDGGQVIPPHDAGIIGKVVQVGAIKKADFRTAVETGKIKILGEDIDQVYMDHLKTVSLSDERGARIAYSPLHGVGDTNVVKLLNLMGFDLVTHPEQMVPDPDFSTVKNRLPNPELPAAMIPVTDLGRDVGAAVAMASDPDADRLGVTIPCPDFVDPSGWTFINGNIIGVLLLDHILRQSKKRGIMPDAPVVIKTIVTTEMLDVLCRDFNVEVIKDLLVGFKYIAESTAALPASKTLIFQMEESHGYNRGTFVRDKDSASAALLFAELASELVRENTTLYTHLNNLYRKYGYFCELTRSVFYPGKSGREIMMGIMDGLRTSPPKNIYGIPVNRVIDRQSNEIRDVASGSVIGHVDQHTGNVMQFYFDETGLNRITARPSGTEPKIKFYAQLWEPVPSDASDQTIEKIKKTVQDKANTLIDAIADPEN